MIKRLWLGWGLGVCTSLSYAEPITCTYAAKHSQAGVQAHEACADIQVDGQLALLPAHLKQLDFDQFGLATVWANGQHYYLNRQGQSLAVLSFDNWADDFADGLVRVRRHGKIGFYNRQFQEVIPAQYDWAAPFAHGIARVCQGCQEIQQGEHRAIVGGTWSQINCQGQTLPSADALFSHPAR